MAPKKLLLLAGASVVGLMFAACSSDDTTVFPTTQGGAAGAAKGGTAGVPDASVGGKGGTAGEGGSAEGGTGGIAGEGGEAGSAGEGGVAGGGAGGAAGKGGGAGSGGKAGTAGQGGTAGGGGGGTAGGGNAGAGGTSGTAGAGGTAGAAGADAGPCSTLVVEGKLKRLDIYFMIDRSGSMTGTPWADERAALSAFWNDPGSSGITVALRFFPYDNSCNPMDATCSGNLYVNPAVPWGVLTSHANVLLAAMDATQPMGCTPTEEALKGLLKGSKLHQLQEPEHVVVGVIVSDGEPVGCDESPSALQAIAATYLNGNPSIRTFALYVASSASTSMNAIAQGGGTTQAYDATNTQNFINALKAVQYSAIPCDFDMPMPDGGVVDPNQVTITYQGTQLNKWPNQTQCGANGGWYFDNNTAPTKIYLCPATCTLLKADPAAKVDISLGCLTP